MREKKGRGRGQAGGWRTAKGGGRATVRTDEGEDTVDLAEEDGDKGGRALERAAEEQLRVQQDRAQGLVLARAQPLEARGTRGRREEGRRGGPKELGEGWLCRCTRASQRPGYAIPPASYHAFDCC